MDDTHRHRTLVETSQYTFLVDGIVARYPRIIPILSGLIWGIATNPKAYSATMGRIRIAKSRSLGLAIPRFRIFFRIENEGKEDEHVLLLWIEEMNEGDEVTEYIM